MQLYTYFFLSFIIIAAIAIPRVIKEPGVREEDGYRDYPASKYAFIHVNGGFRKFLVSRETYSLYIFAPDHRARVFCQDLTSQVRHTVRV